MRTLLLAIAAAVIALDSLVHGMWTDRWSVSPELEQALARLDSVPMAFGEWRGQALALRPGEAEVAGFAGHLLRRYERHDGSAVTVLLACGRAGPLSVHTPEVCYVGAGFTPSGATVPYPVEGTAGVPPAVFWKGKFSKQGGALPSHTRVLWGWHARGAWTAPESPRWTFRGLRMLHKMYITCEMTGEDDQREDAVCAEFLAAFLPQLEKALFAKS